ncbi:winged helix DNA-binding domain-containing protein [Gordonia sp. ABSL11-1]|uniref:winged helix DNA-binding domain-containing protein n=1 Tax=Gordonia sp. ABSL11-1 TaxID=3053924 RepID=UPI0025741919|nr:winged helix DNA-binding domain-containing protein [Gordonia sp. ABSL11-1]MDL9947409.1 winged helix DNA-binding domain-containing protein [Gordonia sp. ABSL11-1]
MTAPTSRRQLTTGQWNRTLLHRQHLLERADEDAIDVLDRCVGLQAQEPRAPFFALASRVADFDPGELDALLTDREVVRMALLRSTIFLIDAEDARWIRPVAQPLLDTEVAIHERRLTSAVATDILADAAELLSGTALSGAELGRALASGHPDNDPSTMVSVVRCGLPLVQVPPRGLWRGSAAPTYQLFDDWVGPGEPAVVGDEARKDLIRLYLRGFGPATVKGIQSWAGLTRLGPLVAEMESDWELTELAGPDGERLFDLEGLDIIDAGTPAPVRLLAPFDNVLVAQTDRRRIADDDRYRSLATPNGRSPGFVLVDGRLAGSWLLDGGRVVVDMMAEPTRRQRSELTAEVERLQAFCDIER